MALNSAGICTAIAALSVSGVSMKDLSGIPEAVDARMCPIFYPVRKTGATSEPTTGPASFGPGMWRFLRDYQYQYLHAAAGEGRKISEHYVAMSAKEDAIITALLGLSVSGVDVGRVQTSEYGVLTDASGNSFFGFTVILTLREKVNA